MPTNSNTQPGISLTQFAEQCGVTVAAVTNWRSRFDDFPAAIDPTAHRLRYEKQVLVQWAQQHGKLAPSADRPKFRLFDKVRSELATAAKVPTPTEVLAAAAVLVLTASLGEIHDDALLGPAKEVFDQLDGEFAETQQSELNGMFGTKGNRADVIKTTIDALRRDYAFQPKRGPWGDDTSKVAARGDDPALAEVALDIGGAAATVVDPCCGIGTGLMVAGRRLPNGTALVGRDVDRLRVAIASALLQAEQLPASLSCGDSFDAKFTRSCRALDGDVLVLATPPAALEEPSKRKATKRWITLLTSALREPSDTTVTVLTTPAAWLSRSFLERGDERRPLLDQQRVDAAVLVSTATDGRRSEAGITRIVGPRTEEPPRTVLLADLTYVPAEHLHTSATALVTNWAADRSVSDRFAKVAQAATPEEVQSIGALVPLRYRQGHPTVDVAPVEPAAAGQDLLRRGPASDSRRAAPPTTASIRSDPDADRWTASVPRPDAFDVPVELLERFIAAAPGSGTPLPDRTPTTRTFNDAIRDGDLVVFSALSGPDDELQGELVELVTGSKGFGDARRRRAVDREKPEHRRGSVYLQPTEQGRAAGITVDFLLAWFASAQLQAELRATARAGRHRMSLSLHDVIEIRADFPDAAECARIAGEWAEVRRVRQFLSRLDHAVRYRREHLLDRPAED